MSRERIIVEIEGIDQALKVEETIRTGYCDPIAENLLAWMAAEEDISDSYESLASKSSDAETKQVLASLSSESKSNIKSLQQLLDTVEEFRAARDRRCAILEGLAQKE
jgi:ferritin-like metal-binding protein YciE